MMGDHKPNFALDLSNEGVALWHRSSGGGWSTLGAVPLAAEDFTEQLAALRDSASKGTGRARRAVIRIPRSEVLLSKVRLGVFEGEAATRHAHKQIAEMSPYAMDEVSFDLGEKGAGNMAPVGIVARQTLIEAEAFAKANGFDPLYFTTQYAEREFTREPRFYIGEAKAAAKPLWFVPWVAAASIGLAAGYFGWSYVSAPDVAEPTFTTAIEEPAEETVTPVVEETAAVVEPEPQPAVDTAQLGLQDVAPALPNVVGAIEPPSVTEYPDLLVSSFTIGSENDDPLVARLTVAQADLPDVSVSSKQLKTSDLQIAEARRDLPDVSVNTEIVTIIEADMAMIPLDTPEPASPIQLASLTTPDQAFDPALITGLPRTILSDGPVNTATTQTAARPVRPPSPITAEPGTLTPTVEGTPGPEYITIFAGRPSNAPRNRVDPLPPELELAGKKPRLRPATLVVPQAEVLAAVEPEEIAEPTILDLADPALRPLRARVRPDTLLVPETVVAEAVVEPEAEALVESVVEETAPDTVVEEPTLLALADPALRPLRARVRPSELSDRAQAVVAQQEIASLGDPALRPFRAQLRPATLVVPEPVSVPAAQVEVVETPTTPNTALASLVENAIADAATQAPAETPEETTDPIAAAIAQDSVIQAIQEEASVLALADPALRPFRARTRPSGLVASDQLAALTTDGAETQTDAAPTLLALADPTLSGVRARTRPSNLRVITPAERNSLLSLADPSLAGKRTRVRPRNLRIIAPEAEPEPQTPNIEALIEEAEAEKPEPKVIRGTRQAVAVSPKPKVRPRNLSRVVQRVTREAARTNASVRNDSNDGQSGIRASGGSTRATAKLPKSAKGTVKSAPPTSTTVARAATEKSKFKKSRMSLVGIFGAPNKRRALIRLPSGRYVKVQSGDKVSGWKVSAIGESSLRINKGSRNQTLRIP